MDSTSFDNAPSFSYAPIEPDLGFRVLILEPNTDLNGELRASIVNCRLNDYPPFEALSYVWGDPTRARSITLDGQQVRITVNLEIALCHLRLIDRPRSLWVDALCINQNDVEERNNHVQYMHEIYARCTRGLLWMGDDSSILVNGLAAMTELGTLMDLDERFHDFMRDYPDAEPIQKLFTDPPVWSRAWIMQEVAYAPSVQLIAGGVTMQWERVEEFLESERYIKRYGIPGLFHGPFSHESSIRTILGRVIAYPQILAHQRRVTRGQGLRDGYGSSLSDVLARFRFTKATNPRDKIFAFLGLTPDSSDVEVNYNQDVQSLYAQVTKQIFKESKSLNLICQGPWQLFGNAERMQNLPSWVPDFSAPGESKIMFAQRNIYNATGEEEIFIPRPSETSQLHLEGCFIDEVALVRPSDVYHWPQKEDYNMFYWIRTILEWMPNTIIQDRVKNGATEKLLDFLKPTDEEYQGSLHSISNDTYTPLTPTKNTFESFWRTLILDCVRGSTHVRGLHRLETAEDAAVVAQAFDVCITTPLDDLIARISIDLEVDGLVGRILSKWVFSISNSGCYCMVPPGTRQGDVLVVLKGSRVPVVLRPVSDSHSKTDDHTEVEQSQTSTCYHWVGTCYIHEYMDGQVLQLPDTEARKQIFKVV